MHTVKVFTHLVFLPNVNFLPAETRGRIEREIDISDALVGSLTFTMLNIFFKKDNILKHTLAFV